MSKKIAIILLAGGQGTRLDSGFPKQFHRISGKTILEHTLTRLRYIIPDELIVITSPHEYLEYTNNLVSELSKIKVIPGGKTRQSSVLAALKFLRKYNPVNILIHDAARPFVSAKIINSVIETLNYFDAVDVAIPATDTIIIEENMIIQSIPERRHIWRGQTPQGFNYQKLIKAYEGMKISDIDKFTDDCGIFLFANPSATISIVEGESENIKITDKTDLVLADELFRIQSVRCDPEKRSFDVRNKTALIFGGTSGIGRALSEILSDSGCKVEIASRGTGVDISHFLKVNEFIKSSEKKLGHIDFVVNAAGILKKGSHALETPKEFAEQVKINLIGALNIAKASYNVLKRSQGMLLNFSSSSYTRGRADYVTYSATKAAIVNMTQGLAEEWYKDGIRVNCIVPGRTNTHMRRSNFSDEAPDTLLNPYEVALASAKIMDTKNSGCVVRV